MTEKQEPASPPLPKECTCGMDGAKAWTPEFDEMVANDPLLARAASIICGAACGMYSACNSREAAVALRDAGLLALPTPTNRTAGETIGGGDGPEEIEIDRLRLAAFHTNSNEDKAAYYLAVSKWFQDRHYRSIS